MWQVHFAQRKQVTEDKQMRAIKNYFFGVAREVRRIRWLKGAGMRHAFFTVLAYAIFFGLFLVLADFIVIRLLQAINFK